MKVLKIFLSKAPYTEWGEFDDKGVQLWTSMPITVVGVSESLSREHFINYQNILDNPEKSLGCFPWIIDDKGVSRIQKDKIIGIKLIERNESTRI